jgi:hypothetical protein
MCYTLGQIASAVCIRSFLLFDQSFHHENNLHDVVLRTRTMEWEWLQPILGPFTHRSGAVNDGGSQGKRDQCCKRRETTGTKPRRGILGGKARQRPPMAVRQVKSSHGAEKVTAC